MNLSTLFLKIYAVSGIILGALWVVGSQFGYYMSPRAMTSAIGAMEFIIGVSILIFFGDVKNIEKEIE